MTVAASEQSTEVIVSPAGLRGLLRVPHPATGLVLFAHGSGSGRLSPRNNFVAAELQRVGLATLLFDLLSEREAGDRRNVFDIELLATRLVQATTWARAQETLETLSLGYFGASTGAAAALVAAAREAGQINAVVSRGGRPDLAEPFLGDVLAPTLLIVGGDDFGVLELNQQAFSKLRCAKRLEVVPGATHLFEEPGALAAVVELASRWFSHHLSETTAD